MKLRPIVRNDRQKMSGLELLTRLDDASAKLVIMDPQYRGVMDAMAYGNEGGRQKARAKLPQMTDRMIGLFIAEAARVLKPSAYLALWVDKFMIGTGAHVRLLEPVKNLAVVDLLCWDSLAFGMGKRLRCSAQYLVIAQKDPRKASGTWSDHRMRDAWPESADRSVHPHAKPYQLTERLIRTTTKAGNLVVDPCAGSYGVLEACRRTKREFIGCDLAEIPTAGGAEVSPNKT